MSAPTRFSTAAAIGLIRRMIPSGRSPPTRNPNLAENNGFMRAPRQWMIVRTAWLFGIGGVSFPRTIIEKAKTGQALKIVNDQFGCPTYASDLAGAMVKLVDQGQNGIWHVTNAG